MKKTEKKTTSETLNQVQNYLKQNKDYHYNFESEHDYTVSSGSLLLDVEMGGGIKPGVIRSTGVTEGGKTSCGLSFARNFQKIPNSMVMYIKSEGRLSADMIKRAGVDTSEEKWFVFKCNVYETVIDFMRELVKNNPEGKKYMFIVDSMDALVPKGDLAKSSDDALKVAGGSLLSSDFLRKMALGLATRGHICYMISQVRSAVKINPYEKGDPKVTNASGGNAILHYSDWILEFQPRWVKDAILSNDKKEQLGHHCKVIFRKSPNEKTGVEVRYPIRYGREDGKSVWVEYEIVDMLLSWTLATAKGAWITVSDDLVEEVKKATKKEIPKQHHGMDKFYQYFEDNQDVTEYLYEKFKEILKESK